MLAAPIFAACQPSSHREREVVIVVTPEAKTAGTVAAGVSGERFRDGWAEVERLARQKRLTPSDLALIAPEAERLRETAGSAGPGVVPAEAEKVRRIVEAQPVDHAFVSQKLERTRRMVAQAELMPEARAALGERLSAVPRLLDEEKYTVANDVLTEIQSELAPPKGAKAKTGTAD